MDYKYIEQLLERYWQCQTTLEEERILRAFFAQDDVPARMLQWKEWFVYPTEALEGLQLGDRFDERIMALVDEPPTVKARTVSLTQRLKPLLKAAAIVAVVLTLGNAIQFAINRPDRNIGGGAADDPVGETTMARYDSIGTDSTSRLPFSEVLHQVSIYPQP